MTTTNPTLFQRLGSVALAVLLVTSLAGAAVAPAVAQTDETDDDSLMPDFVSGILTGVGQTVAEVTGEATRGYEKRFGDDPEQNATENAEEFAATFEDHTSSSPTYGDYLKGRYDATDDRLTYEFTCYDRQGNSATRYVVADRDGTTFVNERVVTPSEFEDMNRTVDYWFEADWYACENAAEELDTFYQDYVLTDKDPSHAYKVKMRAKYMPGVESNMFGDNRTAS